MFDKLFTFLFLVLVTIICVFGFACCHGVAQAQGPVARAEKGPSLLSIDSYRRSLRPFLDALATVESNNDDSATGDDGKAIGRYQIWSIYWDDAKAFAPTIKGEYSDCRNKEYAERVVVAYLLRYAENAVKVRDYQTLARIHNGGPKGARKSATLKYWLKVEKILAK